MVVSVISPRSRQFGGEISVWLLLALVLELALLRQSFGAEQNPYGEIDSLPQVHLRRDFPFFYSLYFNLALQ